MYRGLLHAITLGWFYALTLPSCTCSAFELPSSLHEATLHFAEDWEADRFIVLPEYQILFCYIEKVGCTSFNKFFNFLTGEAHPKKWFKNTPNVHGYSYEDLNKLLLNKSWHKAVFYRHPTDRFLSAYQSKCNPTRTNHCKNTFGYVNVTFDDTIAALSQTTKLNNVHWIPQHKFCGGLSSSLQYYDTVKLLDRSTAREDVLNFLNKTKLQLTPQVLEIVDKVFPKEDIVKSTHPHQKYDVVTNANAFSSKYIDTTSKLSAILDHYMGDYKIFNIKLRPWEANLVQHLPKYKDLL